MNSLLSLWTVKNHYKLYKDAFSILNEEAVAGNLPRDHTAFPDCESRFFSATIFEFAMMYRT